MVNQLLLWAAENSRLEKFVADNPLAKKTVQRFVAGARLSDAVSVAVDLHARGIGGVLDLRTRWLFFDSMVAWSFFLYGRERVK